MTVDFTDLPTEARDLATLGLARCIDYQDRAYADLFTQRIQSLAKSAPASPERDHALAEAARRLESSEQAGRVKGTWEHF